jgi:Na+/phosphate symporter
VQELTSLFEGALLVLECTKDTIITKNKVLSKYVKEEGERLSALANDYATFHEERLVDGLCLSKASSLYLAILDAFKGIWWHCQQIVRKCA